MVHPNDFRMATRMKYLTILIVSFGFTLCVQPTPAVAQAYPCGHTGGSGPGERIVGMSGGANGVIETPMCVSDGTSNESAGPSVPRRDYMKEQMEAIAAAQSVADELNKQTADQFDALAALDRDRSYQRYLNGSWTFFQGGNKPKAGDFCTALWSREGALISISGPGGGYNGGMLTFLAVGMPKPIKAEIVTVTLKQSRYPAQQVKALSHSFPGIEYGAVSLSVPDIGPALATMLDIESFELIFQKKQVAEISWRDGFSARDKLRDCIGKKPR